MSDGAGRPVVLATERLRLRRLEPQHDAAFIVELLNDAAWLRFIGDKRVRTLDDARLYIENGPAAMIERHGFGLYRVGRASDDEAVGICGLVKREGLDDVDIGFALLERFRGLGYASEAAQAVLRHARLDLKLARVVAIVSAGNDASIRLLHKLGFGFERTVRLPPDGREAQLFS